MQLHRQCQHGLNKFIEAVAAGRFVELLSIDLK
jgi:hypothetical protein